MGLRGILPAAARAKAALRRAGKAAAAALLPAAAAIIWLYLAAPAAYAAAPAPEPDRPLRICDAYGPGYFYIPGSDTCLKFSGHVRADIDGGSAVYAHKAGDLRFKTYAWLGRGVIELSTMSDTKYGPLHTYFKLRSDWQDGNEAMTDNNASGAGSLRFAYIELGGLRAGVDETIFAYWLGYYGNVMNDDVLNHANTRTNGVSYTFNWRNGLSVILGAEQGNKDGADNIAYFDEQTQQFTPTNRSGGFRFSHDGRKLYRDLNTEMQNYTPNLLAGVKYEQKWGDVASVLAYDANDSELAAKLRFDLNITRRFSLFVMGAYKTMGDYYNYDYSYGHNGIRQKGRRADGSPIYRYGLYRQVNSLYGDWGGHAAGWVGGTYMFNPKTSFNFETAYETAKSFYSTANITRIIAGGLTMVMEVSYKNWNDDTAYRDPDGNAYQVSLKGKQAVEGAVRFNHAF